MTGLYVEQIEELVQKLCASGKIHFVREDPFAVSNLPDFRLNREGSDIILIIRTFSSNTVEMLVSSRSKFDEFISVYGGPWCIFASAFVEKFFTEDVMNTIDLILSLENYYEKESVLYALQLMFPGYDIVPTILDRTSFKKLDLKTELDIEQLVTGTIQFIEYDWCIRYGKN